MAYQFGHRDSGDVHNSSGAPQIVNRFCSSDGRQIQSRVDLPALPLRGRRQQRCANQPVIVTRGDWRAPNHLILIWQMPSKLITLQITPASSAGSKGRYIELLRRARNFSPKTSNCSVLWHRTLRWRSSARWQGIVRSSINVSLLASATAFAWCSKSIIMWRNWISTMSFARPRHRSVHILASDFATFWVFKEETSQLQSVFHDFPGGKGPLAEFASADLTLPTLRSCARAMPKSGQSRTLTNSPRVSANRSKGRIDNVVGVASLATESRPLGLLAMASRKISSSGGCFSRLASCREPARMLALPVADWRLLLERSLNLNELR